MKTLQCSRAWVFPGQGVHNIDLLREALSSKELCSDIALISDLLKIPPSIISTEINDSILARNDVHSLVVTALNRQSASILEGKYGLPKSVAGYSVGMYSALAVAAVIKWDLIYDLVLNRSRFMIESNLLNPGGMIAVIGVEDALVEEELEAFRKTGGRAWISNYNAPNQLTISVQAIDFDSVFLLLERMKPKRLIRIPVSGGWHSPLMEPATDDFRQLLAGIEIAAPIIPVADNVAGGWLSSDPKSIRENLVKHLTCPVQWASNIRCLISSGADPLIELGTGDMLSKFGFFIDRNVRHLTVDRFLNTNNI
jgi:[acyl-carrier-protein] S-malonyltransferase